ncbi:hypothetical protein [Ensifer aridi]|uniref:hypothetical protein n=1 Tax=Ensifer aridi TaxID=1708715 RepID=UPI000A118224|nr:hypothetical protein [Ensifer aridi]
MVAASMAARIEAIRPWTFRDAGWWPGRPADDDLLDELAHDIDEGLLRLGIGVLAHVIAGGVEDQLDGFRLTSAFDLLIRSRNPLWPVLAATPLQDRCDVPRVCRAYRRRPLDAAGLPHGEWLICRMIWRCSCSTTFNSTEMRWRSSASFLIEAAKFWRAVRQPHRTHHAKKCGGQAGQHPILAVPAQNGLLVGAAGAAEAVDRQFALVVRTAVALLAMMA